MSVLVMSSVYACDRPITKIHMIAHTEIPETLRVINPMSQGKS